MAFDIIESTWKCGAQKAFAVTAKLQAFQSKNNQHLTSSQLTTLLPVVF